ncbi:MAG: adenosine kinase [Deltaproteobacteria bacterium]|nr:adenosine kinase [Deltaproteobacteria bacterium]
MLKTLDVCGIGNAIADVSVNVEDLFLRTHAFDKGSSDLIDAAKQEALLAEFPPSAISFSSGGSVANSLFTIRQLGAETAFQGKVGNDQFGRRFSAELEEVGIKVGPNFTAQGHTGVSLIMVTPDGERTMRTSLGAAAGFVPSDVYEDFIKASKWLFIEGYLLPLGEEARAGIAQALSFARRHNCKTALTLGAVPLVQEFRTEMLGLLDRIDLIIGNDEEAQVLTGVTDWESALKSLQEMVPNAVISAGERGVLAAFDGRVFQTSAFPPAQIVSSVGAGDTLAGGVLYGLAKEISPKDFLSGGCMLATKVLEQAAARLTQRVKEYWDEAVTRAAT